MMNTLNHNATRSASFSEIPELQAAVKKAESLTVGGKKGVAAFEVENVWTGQSLGCVEGGLTSEVETHDTAVFLVGKACLAKGFKA